ncbi:P-loop containing nucleoside triphosphate hydrolase protein [Lyophyllum atratum]|nr:P-loop containing nucleoside triphosphate hydrolase protein [Lyophyllum atratum]
MGATGSGKTTFINLLSGTSNLMVGQGLESCTSVIQFAETFELDGRCVNLIDTPGFDDTNQSDTDILIMIAAFLETTYKVGKKLAGVIYLHRISDVRMGGIAVRNFKMFRELCGDKTLKNVAIVTNRWGEVSRELGEAREAELISKDKFFKPVLDKGARILRHEDTLSSAQRIVRAMLDNQPVPLRIQSELVDEGKSIAETAAGAELNRELLAQCQRHEKEIEGLHAEMEAAIKAQDEETRNELEGEWTRLTEQSRRAEADFERLASDYKEEKARLEQTIRRLVLQHDRQVQDFEGRLAKAESKVEFAVQVLHSSCSNTSLFSLQRPSDLGERTVTTSSAQNRENVLWSSCCTKNMMSSRVGLVVRGQLHEK